MTKKTFIFSIFLFFIISINFANQRIKIPKVYNDVIHNNLVSVGKEIVVNGIIEKSLIKIGGTLNLNGKVNKDVVCIGSKVILGRDFLIKGDLIVIGGSLSGKNPHNVKGNIHNVNFSLKKIDTSITPIKINKKTINLIKIFLLLISLIIALMVFGIIPLKIKKGEELLNDNFLRIGLLGIVSIVVFIIIFLISAILSFVYIGIPIMLIFLIFLICIFILGRTIMFYSIGVMIIGKLNLSLFSPAIFILTGVIVYLVLSYIPIIGFVILKILNIFELGISVGVLFKKRLNLKSISDIVAEYGSD